MTQYASKSILKIIAKDVLGNFLEYGDEVFGVAFGEKQLDTGGIEPDAYLGTLFSDWDEAVLSMGLPADTETYRRYLLVRHLKLFGLKRDKEGFAVTAEKRIPPRLTPEENLEIVSVVIRDMERVRRGEARLNRDGSMEPLLAPNERVGGPDLNTHSGRDPVSGQHFLGVPIPAGPVLPDATEMDFGAFRQAEPILGDRSDSAPQSSSDPSRFRPMRPDDSFGTPETLIDLSSNEPERVSVLRNASAGKSGSSGGHHYSMSIRPGERKTQRIELPGLTLELVVSLDT